MTSSLLQKGKLRHETVFHFALSECIKYIQKGRGTIISEGKGDIHCLPWTDSEIIWNMGCSKQPIQRTRLKSWQDRADLGFPCLTTDTVNSIRGEKVEFFFFSESLQEVRNQVRYLQSIRKFQVVPEVRLIVLPAFEIFRNLKTEYYLVSEKTYDILPVKQLNIPQ